MKSRLALAALAAALSLGSAAHAQQGNLNPRAGSSSTIATGGTAVTIIQAGAIGCYVTNPLSATDQGIMTAEAAYIDPTGAAATTTGNGTNITLQPGQTWYCVPSSNAPVSANATTSGHKLVVVRW